MKKYFDTNKISLLPISIINQLISFGDDQISLPIPKEGQEITGGWRLHYVTVPIVRSNCMCQYYYYYAYMMKQIFKKDVDAYRDGTIPHCLLCFTPDTSVSGMLFSEPIRNPQIACSLNFQIYGMNYNYMEPFPPMIISGYR